MHSKWEEMKVKKKKCAHELNCLFFSSLWRVTSLLPVVVVAVERQSGWKMPMRMHKRRAREKTIRAHREWGIQGWLFFHMHSVCQYDLIFQTTQSNSKVIFVIFIYFVLFCFLFFFFFIFFFAKVLWIIYAPKKHLSMIWRIFRLQQSRIYTKQSHKYFSRKWNANWIVSVFCA